MVELKSVTCISESGECSLSPSDFSRRIEDWKAVASQATSRRSYEGKVISTYLRTIEIRQRLEDLISAEAECCPFLEFEIRDGPDSIEVELHYPPDFEAVIGLVVPGLVEVGSTSKL